MSTGDSPVGFIIAINLERRHLDKGQRIALALDLEPHFAKEAKKRMAEGGSKASTAKPAEKGKGQCPLPDRGQARDKAAKSVGVSGKLVSAAKAIKEADPVERDYSPVARFRGYREPTGEEIAARRPGSASRGGLDRRTWSPVTWGYFELYATIP